MSILYNQLVIGGSPLTNTTTTQPLAYYRLGETSGTTATDSSGSGNNGTIASTGVTYSQNGAIASDTNKALLLNGTSGTILCPTAVNTSTWTSLTVECWVKLSNITFTQNPRLLANSHTDVDLSGFSIGINAGAGSMDFAVGNGSSWTQAHAIFSFSSGVYYHIVGVWDGSTIFIYINGVLQASTAFSGTSMGTPTSRIGIGYNPSYNGDFLPGTIDEVSICSYAMPANTVLGHYNTGILSDSNPYTVSTGNVIYATDVNQIANILQRQPGSSETGHYAMGGNVYTTSGILSSYIYSLSRISVPVSASVDTADKSPTGGMTTPATNHVTMGGLEIFSTTSAASTSSSAAGNYTLNY